MKIQNITRKEFKTEIVPNKKIICWGIGKNAQKCIDEFDMTKSILFFVDNDTKKQGGRFEQWSVENPNKIMNYKDSILLITVRECFEILEQIQNWDENLEVYCYELMQDYPCALTDLEDIWYFERMVRPGVKRYIQNLRDEKLDEQTIKEKADTLGKKLSTKKDGKFPLVLPRLVLILTDKCTLCCEGCCSFVDKFTSPKHMNMEKILDGVQKIFENIDGCINVQLIGGEPFMHPEFEKILDYLVQEKKAEKIGIITNGTIVPKKEIMLKLQNDKIFIEISNYGFLEMEAKVICAFEQYQLHFKMFTEQPIWADYGDPAVCRNKTEEELKSEYLHCVDGKKCKAFDGERLYMCYHAAKLQHLGVEWDYKHDSRVIDEGDVRQNILDCYLQKYTKACNYCAEMVKNKKQIPVGVQKNGGLKKSEYTIISREELERLKS